MYINYRARIFDRTQNDRPYPWPPVGDIGKVPSNAPGIIYHRIDAFNIELGLHSCQGTTLTRYKHMGDTVVYVYIYIHEVDIPRVCMRIRVYIRIHGGVFYIYTSVLDVNTE